MVAINDANIEAHVRVLIEPLTKEEILSVARVIKDIIS
jgi:hypothetical protein